MRARVERARRILQVLGREVAEAHARVAVAQHGHDGALRDAGHRQRRRRYGFILGEDGARYFTHAGELRGAASLYVGQRVTFKPVKAARGLRALAVQPLVEEEVR